MMSRESSLQCNRNSSYIPVALAEYHRPPAPSWLGNGRNSSQPLQGDIHIGQYLDRSRQWRIQYYIHTFRNHPVLNSRIRPYIDHTFDQWLQVCTHIDPSFDHTGCCSRLHCSHRMCNPRKRWKFFHLCMVHLFLGGKAH